MIRDFFELTELPFDESEKLDKKTVIAQVEIAKKKVCSDINHYAKDMVKRDDLLAENEILNSVYNKDAKGYETYDSQRLEALAALRREDATKQLNLLIRSEILLMSIKRTKLLITNERIKDLRMKTGLSEATIKELYKKSGFSIVPDKRFEFPKVFGQIQESITKAKETRDVRYSDLKSLKQITDLYALAAFAFDPDKVNEANVYRSMSNSELIQRLDDYRKKHATSNDPVNYLLREAAGRAIKSVFDSNGHRNMYDIYLKYLSPEVAEILTVIKLLPEAELQDHITETYFVDALARYLGDPDIALAIYYNQVGNREPLRAN